MDWLSPPEPVLDQEAALEVRGGDASLPSCSGLWLLKESQVKSLVGFSELIGVCTLD